MKQKLKIGYFADGPWSHKAFDILNSDERLKIEFIVPRFKNSDQKLKEYSEIFNIDFIIERNINDTEFINKVSKYNCDLFISMSFNQIFKNAIIDLTPLGIINCHAGKLPFYRGRNILNWVLINGESEFGITVHFVDTGIDTGDIIKQKTYKIEHDYDYKKLLSIAYSECAEILHESVIDILNGENDRIKQNTIDPIGSYCRKRIEGDEIINWDDTTNNIYNFIRAISTPGPNARTYVFKNEIQVKKAKFSKNNFVGKYIPGEIVNISNDVLTVKTKDSFIDLIDYICDCNIVVGTILKR